MKTGTVFCCAVIVVFSVVLSSLAQTIGQPVKECEFLKQLEQSRLDNYHATIRSSPDLLPAGKHQSDFVLTEIVPDFQISENAGYAYAGGVAWAENDAGLGVAVWIDGRNGGCGIFGRRFLDGSPVGSIFMIDRFAGYYSEGTADVEVAPDNKIIVVYQYQNGCYAKIFNDDGSSHSDRFTLRDEGFIGYTRGIDVAVDSTGRALAVWCDRRENADYHLYGQRFTTDGECMGSNVLLSENYPMSLTSGAAVAINNEGTAMAAWVHSFDYDSSSIGACIWPAGAAEPNDVVFLDGEESDLDNIWPELACDGSSTFIACWNTSEWTGSSYTKGFVVKAYECNGQELVEKRVRRFDGDFGNSMELAVNRNGNILAVASWSRMDLLFMNNNFELNSAPQNIQLDDNLSAVAAGLDNDDQVTFFWQAYERVSGGTKRNYYFQQYNWGGDALFTKILTDSIPYGSCLQYEPQMAVFDDGGFVVTWADRRSGLDDYYLRCFDADGTPRGNAVQIFDWDGSFIHFHWHLLNADREGNIVVTAFRCGGDGKGYVCQRFSSDGAKLGDNVYLGYSDVGYLAYATAIDQSGFSIIWSQTNLYLQRFDNAGTAVGAQIQINETDGGIWTNGVEKKIQRVHPLNDGGFVAAWAGDWSDEKPAAIQRFAADGSRIGGNVFLTDDQEAPVACEPEILSDGDTLHYVFWSESDNGSTVYRAQRFDSGWAKAGNMITIGGLNSSTVWSMDAEGRITAVWGENGNICGRCYGPDMQTAGSVFMINGASEADQSPPVFSELHNGRIYTAWADNRIPNTGYSIWGNVLEWTNFLDVPDEGALESFILSQNYPNPFNPGTTLEYTLPDPANVDLRIFDVRGREVAVLTAGEKEAGTHTVQWNAAGMPSGLYFARLKAGNEVRVRKMVLQR